MQGCAPGAVDTSNETDATKTLYGLDNKITEPFGRQCLMARRLVEHGVRFVQLYQGGLGNQNTDTWDAHDNVLGNHTQHAAESDLPIAGLLTDLKARGLLDSTLVIWHAEFGRMPISQRGVGRDHNPGTMAIWMAGAGIKGGQVIGASDDFGYKAVEQPVSYHDLHATMLHLLGLDHTKLTYRANGRDMRLTDVYGTLIRRLSPSGLRASDSGPRARHASSRETQHKAGSTSRTGRRGKMHLPRPEGIARVSLGIPHETPFGWRSSPASLARPGGRPWPITPASDGCARVIWRMP